MRQTLTYTEQAYSLYAQEISKYYANKFNIPIEDVEDLTANAYMYCNKVEAESLEGARRNIMCHVRGYCLNYIDTNKKRPKFSLNIASNCVDREEISFTNHIIKICNISPNPTEEELERIKIYADIAFNPFEGKYMYFAMSIAGYTEEEIAKKIGIPLGTLKSRLNRARKIRY